MAGAGTSTGSASSRRLGNATSYAGSPRHLRHGGSWMTSLAWSGWTIASRFLATLLDGTNVRPRPTVDTLVQQRTTRPALNKPAAMTSLTGQGVEDDHGGLQSCIIPMTRPSPRRLGLEPNTVTSRPPRRQRRWPPYFPLFSLMPSHVSVTQQSSKKKCTFTVDHASAVQRSPPSYSVVAAALTATLFDDNDGIMHFTFPRRITIDEVRPGQAQS